MKKIIFLPLVIALVVFLSACIPSKPKLNDLQIEAMQTQTFQVSKRNAFNATMTVFQNKGYIINTANFDTGFITAKSPTEDSIWNNMQGISSKFVVTAFVTQSVKNKKVYSSIRLNFVKHETFQQNNHPKTQNVQILDPKMYQDAFKNIRQQIFIANSVQM